MLLITPLFRKMPQVFFLLIALNDDEDISSTLLIQADITYDFEQGTYFHSHTVIIIYSQV